MLRCVRGLVFVAEGMKKVHQPEGAGKRARVVGPVDSPKPRALAARQMEATQIRTVPDWLVVDRDNFSGTVSRIPTREEIAPVVNEQLVVELYSR